MSLMQNWVVRKPVAASRGGIVASQNGVAAAVGAEILAAGGSAVDAVVATALALSVREPWNSGLGSIGFMVVTPPGGGRAEVVDFGPIAPAGLDLAAFGLTGETATSPAAVTTVRVSAPAALTVLMTGAQAAPGEVLVWTGGERTAPPLYPELPLSDPQRPRQEDQPTQTVSPPAELRTPEAERRQLTVLFCDLVDSTALAT